MEYTCSTCKITKDEEAFGVCSTYATGRNPRCKECCNRAAKKTLARKRHNDPELLERIEALETSVTALKQSSLVTRLTSIERSTVITALKDELLTTLTHLDSPPAKITTLMTLLQDPNLSRHYETAAHAQMCAIAEAT